MTTQILLIIAVVASVALTIWLVQWLLVPPLRVAVPVVRANDASTLREADDEPACREGHSRWSVKTRAAPSPDEMACVVSRLAVWWRQPDHYDWLTGYLASWDLQKFVRLFVAATTAMLRAITLAMTWSPAVPRPRGDVHRSAAVSGVVHGDGFALGAPGG